MKRLQHELGSIYQFFQKGVSNFDQTAALIPSSPFLVDAMLDPTGFARGADALCRVEVDPVGVARGRFEPIEAGA